MKRSCDKHSAFGGAEEPRSTDIEQLLKITDDDELKKLLGIQSTGGNAMQDINTLRVIWKKEKNRIAAKKSREKKAALMVELEKKEIYLSNQLESLKRFIIDYDGVVESLLRYIKYSLAQESWGVSENLPNQQRGPSKAEIHRDVVRKLICCLEYFYHIRNNENFVLPCVSNPMANRQDVNNRLIDEIIYTLKNYSNMDINK
ncbi:hypothetical protein PAPHI01_1492 [Pancytospora philotis]|nr:hypothetical protein PAPHI01_1492 [Pancytospora philotis]